MSENEVLGYHYEYKPDGLDEWIETCDKVDPRHAPVDSMNSELRNVVPLVAKE